MSNCTICGKREVVTGCFISSNNGNTPACKECYDYYENNNFSTNPENIKTDTVQLWRGSCMVTAQLKNADAKQMVKDGKCFVITSQAIGYNE